VYPARDQELPSARPLVALIFEPIRANTDGKEPRLSSAAKPYCRRVAAWRRGLGGMALGVRRRHRLGSHRLGAPVAQLDRALPSEGRGQGFESLRVRH
jgi:hypothetical protein